jgi:glyoxylase-like metal-dependent hydrolase (beta-lactamase superfamily II)
MMHQLSRRQLIGALGAASILKGQASNSYTQVPSWKTEMRQLAPNIFAYVQTGGPGMLNQGVSNGGLIAGDDHVMAIDSLGAPLQSKAFLAAIQKTAPGKPIRRVLITHHHGDHIWGLPFFPPAEILSHPYCREAMLANPRFQIRYGRSATVGRLAESHGKSYRRRLRSTTSSLIITAACR